MKATTRARLQAAMDWCDENDKSTEFMIQYMQDMVNVPFDCAMNFLRARRPRRIQAEGGQAMICGNCGRSKPLLIEDGGDLVTTTGLHIATHVCTHCGAVYLNAGRLGADEKKSEEDKE